MSTDELKTKLVKERDDLELLLKELNDDEAVVKGASADTDEISDQAEEFQEKQHVFSQKELVTKRLTRIRSALKRVEAGSYSICVTCGEPIEEMRLKIDPATETCRKCSVG